MASHNAPAPVPTVQANRILLLLDSKGNRGQLAELLGRNYQLAALEPGQPLDLPFDLCILDAPALARCSAAVHARKVAEAEVFLPFLLVASRTAMAASMQHLWRAVDEVVCSPVDKFELQARIEMLLRARRMSLELKLRSDDLEAFIHAMTHDLRAPLRTITGFIDEIAEDQSGRLDDRGRHQVHRIRTATTHMWSLIACLVEFSRIGRKAIRLQTVEVAPVLALAIDSLQAEIARSGAEVTVEPDLGAVIADASLLKIALTNLISNGIKFVTPGLRPRVVVRAKESSGKRCIEIQDNGIGIPPEQQESIFTPFIRLFGEEDYAGFGLGLSAARKVVEIMGGHIGLSSQPGEGSIFWIELGAGN